MDSMELEETGGVVTHDTGRRDFLKRSAAVGALAWSAPAITSLAAGRAWAQSYPPPCPCSSTSTGLIVEVPGLGINESFPSAPDPCLADHTIGDPTDPLSPLYVVALTICSSDDKDAAGNCTGKGSIESLTIGGTMLGGASPISASVLTAQTDASCNPAKNQGTTDLMTLSVGGVGVSDFGPCNHDVFAQLGLSALGQLWIHRQVCNGEELTVQALNLVLAGGAANIVAAQSVMTGTGVCNACA